MFHDKVGDSVAFQKTKIYEYVLGSWLAWKFMVQMQMQVTFPCSSNGGEMRIEE